MDKRRQSLEQRLVIDMLRIINRYEGAKSSQLLHQGQKKQDPLRLCFQFNKGHERNKRNHQRIAFEGEVNLNKDDDFIVGYCLNISASGIYMTCHPQDFVRVNDHVHLIIKLHDNEEIFRAPARVARADRNGYALQFMTLATSISA
ncbi:MAG: PilZ domain-containing protein [Oligoflexus sp.]